MYSLSLSDSPFQRRSKSKSTLFEACHSNELVFFLVFSTSAGSLIVIVAMFVMTKNPTMRTSMKVTMSMKTTGHHRVLRIVWSCFSFSTVPFSLSVFSVLYGVATSSWVGLYDLVLISVVIKNSCVILPFQRSSAQLSRPVFVYPFVHECAYDVVCSVIVFLCGTQIMSCFLKFFGDSRNSSSSGIHSQPPEAMPNKCVPYVLRRSGKRCMQTSSTEIRKSLVVQFQK